MIDMERIDELAELELEDANKVHFKYFASDHECYSVIKEELEEAEEEMARLKNALEALWIMVKMDADIEDILIDMKRICYFLIAEAIQVSAMCEKGLRTNAMKEVDDE